MYMYVYNRTTPAYFINIFTSDGFFKSRRRVIPLSLIYPLLTGAHRLKLLSESVYIQYYKYYHDMSVDSVMTLYQAL